MKSYCKLIAIAIICFVALTFSIASADDLIEAWILCNPKSYVNIRTSPSRKSGTEGFLDCGDKIMLDGYEKNGFLHCIVSNETGEGWVHNGYVTYYEPVRDWQMRKIDSNGRVACRKTIGGKRTCWVSDTSIVLVYWSGDEWSITNKGFIKTEYIGGAVK